MSYHADYFAIIDSIQQRIALKGTMGRLRKPERNIWLVDRLTLQLHSGGFQEYFFSHDGRYVAEALGALRTMDALPTAELVQQAIQVYPIIGCIRDKKLRQQLLLDVSVELAEQWLVPDTHFIAASHTLTEVVVQYAQKQTMFAHLFYPAPE